MSPRLRRVSTLLCLIALAPGVVGCGGSSASAGFDTPEACFAAMKTAAKNKDFPAMCDCISEESVNAVAGALVMLGSMTKMMSGMAAMDGPEAAAEAEKSLSAISAALEKHGVTEEALKDMAPDPQVMGDAAALTKLADMVQDKKAFIADMVAAMEQSQQGRTFSEKFDEQAVGELKDVKIDGDRAAAVVSAPAGDQPVEFRKSGGGGWKMHFDLTNMPAQGGAAPPG